jgi:hypothetical protein
MSKITLVVSSLLLIGFLAGCAGNAQTKTDAAAPAANASNASSASNTAGAADAAADAANAAAAAMDAAARGEPLSRPSAAGAPPAGAPAAAQAASSSPDSRGKPAWVDSPDSVYSKQRYVAAVGFGPERGQAERNALANLTAVFGQSIQAEMKSVASYSEAVKSGVIQVSENVSVQEAISTSAEMDSLIGAEIADVWYDGKSVYYAAAVMEKAKTELLYADLIRSNERVITDLTTMTQEEKNTLNGYSRYQLAATIADTNRLYANVLTYVGNSSGINPGDMKRGADYRLEAAGIVRTIPIGVKVSGDRQDRIKNAFTRALGSAGFRSGGSNPRYTLEAVLTLSPMDLPNQQNKFVRYTVDANLMDSAEGNSVIMPFNVGARAGHLTIPEAENRAISMAEKEITEKFAPDLLAHLAVQLPRR